MKFADVLRCAIGLAGWLLAGIVLPAQAQTWSTPNLGGYLSASVQRVSDLSYGAGYTQYKVLWPAQSAYWNSSFSASLACSTWLNPQCSPGIYCDIEGGSGMGFRSTSFGIGAVAGNGFTNYANGVSSGNRLGVYGAAQLSPCLLFPPLQQLFRNGTCGQFAGYGYLALPLLPGKATTDGINVPTGDRWWTLFFNTRNFQGPVAVITPHFYAQVTESNTNAAGKMLDSCWYDPSSQQLANETHTVPGKEYDGPEGSYLRVEPMFAALNNPNTTNGTIALNSPTVYDHTLWNAVAQWLTNNGAAPVGPFTQGTVAEPISGGSLGWGVWHSPLYTNGGMSLNMGAYMGISNPDSKSFGYQWGTNQVTYTQFANGTPAVVIPQYYQLITITNNGVPAGQWTPVPPEAVPAAAQLASVNFDNGLPSIPATWTAPSDPAWSSPGPAAGPFQVRLDDGMLVTYSWYRFEDQPALLKADLTQVERDQLQAEVVKIHSAWTNGGAYMAPPTMGTLVDVDPALLVAPPTNLPAAGYVPIATSETWGGWVTYTWNQATSGNWSGVTNWASAAAPGVGGHSYYSLNFAPSGTYVATNDLSNGYGYGGYVVNQMSFAGAVTLTGNPIALTTVYGSWPQINQNSGNGVVINTPLNLDVSTVLGGTGSGLVVISNVISGPWHSLTLNSPGTWRICGLRPNTYSGGTIISRGTLIWGATTNGASPDCSYALGSGPVTLSSGATLQFEKASPTNALTLNGGTLYAANSAGVTWLGPVTINTNSAVRTDYGMGISANVSGAGGLTKTGTNTLTLSGVNSYAGATLVQTGTLACATSAALGAGALSISNGAVVNLSYSGTRSIFSLTLGGVKKLAGVYGSSNSPAIYQDAHFSGTGTVTVPVPVSLVDLPATGVATNLATLNASLGMTLAYGGTNAGVLAYWGTANGGTNPAAWAKSAYVGKWANVISTNLSYTATSLAPNTTYYFTFLATNAVYSVWATNVLSFTTPQPPTALAFASVPLYPAAGYAFSLTLQAQDGSGKPQIVTSNTTVQLSVSSGAGTLSGTVSGTIAIGSSNVVISGLVYSAADTMTLNATATTGMSLTAAASPPITFMPLTITGTLGCSSTTLNGSVIITFTNGSGTWTRPDGLTNVEVLVVGGGGGGGGNSGGGGGAGGVIHTNGFRIIGSVTVTVGGGGIGGTNGGAAPGNGTNSVFSSLTAVGGGRGASSGSSTYAAGSGGSGGGGFWNSKTGGGGTAGQGNSGGNMTSGSGGYAGAGGGGAGAVGGAANVTAIGGAGGAGVQYSISGSAQWYGGGGGGGDDSQRGGQAGSYGGLGGGGNGAGSVSGAAVAGVANTGGGGGGGANSTYPNGADGGSGMVIVSFPVTVSPPAAITNTPAIGITSSAAALNATLGCAGANAFVYAHWNTVNGGTNAALWTNSAYVGSWTNAASTDISYTATGLVPNTTYYFAFRATNSAYNVWATNVQSFTTLTLLPPTPVLPVSGVKLSNGVPAFTFTAAAGCRYRLDYKNALRDAGWTYGPWSTNTSGNPLSMTLTDPSAAGQAQRFYRVEAAYP